MKTNGLRKIENLLVQSTTFLLVLTFLSQSVHDIMLVKKELVDEIYMLLDKTNGYPSFPANTRPMARTYHQKVSKT